MAPQFPPIPQIGTFPPAGPTTLVATIPSYLYQQYADDDDLQAFVNAFNELAQVYVTWFATIALTAYTGGGISGLLLDWVAAGVYGILRPALSSGRFRAKGPYGTFAYGTWPFGEFRRIGPSDVTVTTDDIFKRIITWNFYKGDGNAFNVRWLKRRIMRFLLGENGTAPNVDQTYVVSVTFGADNVVSIQITTGTRKIIGGAVYGKLLIGQQIPYGGVLTQFTPGPAQLPFEDVLQEALEAGVLQLPFQYTFLIGV